MKKDKAGLSEELRSLSPLLSDLKGKPDGMQVPPNYFAQLESEIFRNIDEGGFRRVELPASSGQRFRFVRYSRYAMAAAAVLCVILAAYWFLRPAPTPVIPANYQELAASLSPEDAEAYIMDNIQEFESNTLEQYAVVTPVAEPSAGSDIQPVATPKSARGKNVVDDLSKDQIDQILDDMSDEELEKIL